MGLELIELETFVAVAQAGSFSVAALQMHVTQSTVTGRIQRLESALGTKLLRRTTRKVETTAQGLLLFTKANKALAELGKLVYSLRKKAHLERQRVVVAATPTLAALVLAPVIYAYSERFPDVEVELLDLQYASLLEAIDSGAADMGVLALEGEDSRYRFEPLWSDDVLLVAPKSHVLANFKHIGPEEFAKHPLILLDQYQGLRARIADELHRRGLSIPPSKMVANLNTMLGMLDAGIGITLLPRFMVDRIDPARHAIIEIDGVDLSRRFGLVYARRVKLSAAGESFSRHLRLTTPELMVRVAGNQST